MAFALYQNLLKLYKEKKIREQLENDKFLYS